MKKIPPEEVSRIAALSRLELKPDEAELYGAQLGAVLEYVEKMNELDTSGVNPTSHVLDLRNVSRQDEAGGRLSAEDALGNAPERSGGLYRVPRIIE